MKEWMVYTEGMYYDTELGVPVQKQTKQCTDIDMDTIGIFTGKSSPRYKPSV
jgi:hypothetical protein